jgi:hypothetical protein
MSHAFSIKTMWRSMFCALVATFTLSVRIRYICLSTLQFLNVRSQAMNPFRTGKLVLFQVTYDRDWHFFEIIFFVILGIFGVSKKSLFYVLNILSNTSHIETGPLWSFYDKIQPTSCCLSPEVSRKPWGSRSSHIGHPYSVDRIF